MAIEPPSGVSPGQIYRHPRFYRNPDGDWKPKFLLILAWTPCGDIVFRLLTSRIHGRPEISLCSHGYPYPSFFLGYLGGNLSAKTWVDLRGARDYDSDAFAADIARNDLAYEAFLPVGIFCSVLNCVSNAEDTTAQQARRVRDQRAMLACG